MKVVVINAYGLPFVPDYICKDFGIAKDDLSFLKDRTNPALIESVEKHKSFENPLAVVEIPDGIEWAIQDYDGWEYVSEKHREWYFDDIANKTVEEMIGG